MLFLVVFFTTNHLRNFRDPCGHVVIHNWSFVVKLCGTTALLYKSFVVQLLFPQAQKWVCGKTSGGRRDGL